MRYISVFSGVEAATLAWEPLGWEPVCFCEIDDFPSAVLRYRWPSVPNLGDITKVRWKEVLREWGPVDLVVGEAPASPSASPESEMGSKGHRGSCGSMFDAFVRSSLVGFFGRTSRERSQARMGRISDACSKPWMRAGTVSHGGYSTRSSSAWPSDASVSSLSEALETRDVPARYFLSPTACAGILRRAERRWRSLPPELEEALRRQAGR